MFENSHINLPVHWEFVEPIKRSYDLPDNPGYTLERWQDKSLCEQTLNCLSQPFVDRKLRGGKNV